MKYLRKRLEKNVDRHGDKVFHPFVDIKCLHQSKIGCFTTRKQKLRLYN